MTSWYYTSYECYLQDYIVDYDLQNYIVDYENEKKDDIVDLAHFFKELLIDVS